MQLLSIVNLSVSCLAKLAFLIETSAGCLTMFCPRFYHDQNLYLENVECVIMGSSNSKLQICSYCRASIPPPAPKPKNAPKKDEIATIEANSEAVFSDSSDDDEDDATATRKDTIDFTKTLPPFTILCPRCDGLNPRPNARNKSAKTPADAYKRYIDHLTIAPFIDTLQNVEEKELDSEYLIKSYLMPYFKENESLLLRAPYRLHIKGVEFKVIGAYPPKGYVSGDLTQFHVTTMDNALHLLNFEPLKEIHCLPTAASLETYHAIHGIVPDEEDEDHSNKDLHRVSLRPYLMGNDKLFYVNPSRQTKELEAAAADKSDNGMSEADGALESSPSPEDPHDDGLKSLKPNKPNTKTVDSTESKETKSSKTSTVYMSDETLFGGNRVGVKLQNTKNVDTESQDMDHKETETKEEENENTENAQNLEDTEDAVDTEAVASLSEKSQRRHLCIGETFVSFGIQWRVMKCVPSNGYVTKETKVIYKGKPLSVCKKVTLRPIYESVPFSHRNFTPKQYKTHYLDSWSRGASQYIGHSREGTLLSMIYVFYGLNPL